MTATSQEPGRHGLDRRGFLRGTTAIAAMAVSGSALIHTTEAWGIETKTLKPETMRTLIKMARDIYPHDRVADRFYAVACKTYDDKAAADAKLRSLIEDGVASLDKAANKRFHRPYAALGWEDERITVLRDVEKGAFFARLRGDLVVSLYNQKDLWPLFGYEGESASKGGYVNRGFNDINWL